MLAVTALAPRLGLDLAGLLSPFPVFGAVLAVFAHRTGGPTLAADALGGLVVGLASPTVFFLVLSVGLPVVGVAAFAGATVAALLTQAGTGQLVTAPRPLLPAEAVASQAERC